MTCRRVPAATDKQATTSVSMQRGVNTTIEEAVFSMWFANIHFWATDVFSMGPAQNI
jgi:hypothetical protein